MNAQDETPSPARDTLRAAIDRACADLPLARRKRVVGDLIAHLDELPREEVSRILDDVDGYVAEVREAWGLQIVSGKSRSRRPLVALVVAAVLIAAGAGAAIGAWTSHSSGTTEPRNAVVVPTLFGLTQDKATALLASVGLSAAVDYRPQPEDLGAVLSQQPAEGDKVRQGSHVMIQVGAPVGGPLLTAMPTRAVPFTQIAAINTGRTLVLYYAGIAIDGPPAQPHKRSVTVGGITAPLPNVGAEQSGICNTIIIFTAGEGGPGSGGCTDPRQLARITYTYVGDYLFGVTSVPAASMRIDFTGTPAPITVTTRTSSQFSGLRFFVAKTGIPSPGNVPTATIAALDTAGMTLLSLTEPPS